MFVPNLMETVPMVMQNMKNVFRQSSEKQPKKNPNCNLQGNDKFTFFISKYIPQW